MAILSRLLLAAALTAAPAASASDCVPGSFTPEAAGALCPVSEPVILMRCQDAVRTFVRGCVEAFRESRRREYLIEQEPPSREHEFLPRIPADGLLSQPS